MVKQHRGRGGLVLVWLTLSTGVSSARGQGFEIMGSSEGSIFGKPYAAISYDVRGVLPSRAAEPWFPTLYSPPLVTIVTDPPQLRPEGITVRNGLLYVSGDWNETQNQIAVFTVNSWGDLTFDHSIKEPLPTPPATAMPNTQWWGAEGMTFNTGATGIGAGATSIVSVDNQQQGLGSTFAEINPATGVLSTFRVEAYPEDICYAPASQRFYLLVRSPNEMRVMDPNMNPLGISWALPSRSKGVAVVSESFGRALTGDNTIVGEVVLVVSAENPDAIPPLTNRLTAYTANGALIGATVNMSWVDLSLDNSSQGGTVPGPHTFQGITVDEVNHVIYLADDSARAVYALKPFTSATSMTTGPIAGRTWKAQGVYVKTVLPSRSAEPWYPALAANVSEPPRLAPEGMTFLDGKLYVSGDWNETQNQIAVFNASTTGALAFASAIQSPITNPPPNPTLANNELWGAEGITFNTAASGYGASASALVTCEDAQYLLFGNTRALVNPVSGALSGLGTLSSIVGAASPDDIAFGPATARFYVIADADVLQAWTTANPPVYAGTQFPLMTRSKGLAVISEAFTQYLLNNPLLTGEHLLVVAKSLVQSTTAPHNRLAVYSTTGIQRAVQDLHWVRDALPGAPLQEFEAVTVDELNKIIYIGDEKAQCILVLTSILPLTISTTSPLPPAVSGQAYSQNISATGGAPPYTYSVSSGALPTGISLAPNGTVSGATSLCGRYSLTVQALDSSLPAQVDFRSFDFNVSSAGMAGDCNADGFIDGNDIVSFVTAYLIASSGICGADLNTDFIVNDADLPLFVNALLGN